MGQSATFNMFIFTTLILTWGYRIKHSRIIYHILFLLSIYITPNFIVLFFSQLQSNICRELVHCFSFHSLKILSFIQMLFNYLETDWALDV